MRELHFSIFKFQKGSITPALLIITGAFLTVIYGLLILLALQVDYSNRQLASEQALNIAEAGVNYYRWHLAHDPSDFQDGTGQSGPYIHQYTDPEGGVVGTYSLEIIPPQSGSSIVTIRSTGSTQRYPNVRRTIEAQYGIPSLTRFSFLQNSSAWYGTNITVNGDVHSNGGIRMDGRNTARVTSARETYICGSETGCSTPTQRPGVWGSGGDRNLWEFPVPLVDFNSISFDFAAMRDSAQQNGLYLNNTGLGYRLIFNSDGTVNVRRVTSTSWYNGYDPNDNPTCQRRYQVITGQNNIGTYNVRNLPIIFAENYLWVEGTISGRTTVVAARFPLSTNFIDIWIPNNLVYASYDGSNALGLIAQDSIYFGRDIPENFQIDAALLAQGGRIMRHGYYSGCGSAGSHNIKDSLTINGSVMSYEKSYWNYLMGGVLVSGFITRTINYDGNLLFAPPPYFPTSGEYQFLNWKEI